MNTDDLNTPFHQAQAPHQADDDQWNTQAPTGCWPRVFERQAHHPTMFCGIRAHPCSSVVNFHE
jgi:hypothetical protein